MFFHSKMLNKYQGLKNLRKDNESESGSKYIMKKCNMKGWEIKKTPEIFTSPGVSLYRRWESNPHDIAVTGF